MSRRNGPALSKGLRKFIRERKAHIRRSVADEKARNEALMSLRTHFGARHK